MSKFGRQRDRKIPLVRDVATRFFEIERGTWPRTHTAIVLAQLPQLVPGSVFTITNLRPDGAMGQQRQYRVLDTRFELYLHAEKYSQLVVDLLIEPVEISPDLYSNFVEDEL